MLLRFSVSNHASFFERQEFSLVATALKDKARGLIACSHAPNGAVVPAAVIYGANASGKSNLLSALRFLRATILYSHQAGSPAGGIPRIPFALDESANSINSKFDIDFVHNDVRYHYGFEVSANVFEGEWLYTFNSGKPTLLFNRTGPSKIEFGRSLKGRNKLIFDITRPNSSFFSAAIINNHSQLTEISNFFVEQHYIDDVRVSSYEIERALEDTPLDDRTISFLTMLNTGIVGYKVNNREASPEDLDFRKGLESLLRKQHPDFSMPEGHFDKEIKLAHKSRSGGEVLFDPARESLGTRRLLLIVSSIFNAMDRGGLIVIDELDASLHTQACEAVIGLLSSKKHNKNGCQLLCTTHDTNLMRSSILRRDQIWFAEKSRYGESCVFPLSNIKLRKGDNFEKGYLQGRYGALPFSGPVAPLFDYDQIGTVED